MKTNKFLDKGWFLQKFPKTYVKLGSLRRVLENLATPRKARKFNARELKSSGELVKAHFEVWVRDDFQPVFEDFRIAIEKLDSKEAAILETGTSAWGVDSSRLFDSYVRRFGGSFWSIDIRDEPRRRLMPFLCNSSHMLVGDSLSVLPEICKYTEALDLIYLDSLDVLWETPEMAADHCLAEWNIIQPLCGPGTLVLIDDTPKDMTWLPRLNRKWERDARKYFDATGIMPGKGQWILREAGRREDVSVIWHGYNLLLQFHEAKSTDQL